MTAKAPPLSKLISAIRAARLSGVVIALDDGADLEETDVHGHRGLPLRTACFEGNLAIVRELLIRGADPNASAADGASAPLRLALRRGNHEIAALLIQEGAHLPAGLTIPPEVLGIRCAPLPGEAVVPTLPSAPVDNLIEFSPSKPSFQTPGSAAPETAEAFGTETNAISADLMFMDLEDIPPLPWEAPSSPK
jgi:hypothetical protein